MTLPGSHQDEPGPRVASALPAALEARLRASACGGELLPLPDCTASFGVLDVLVVDPTHLPDAELDALAARLAREGPPCVVYTTATQAALERVAAYPALQPLRVFVAGVDDDPAQLAGAIADAAARVNPAVLRNRLTGLLPPLPPTMQVALDLLLRRPERFFDAVDLARHAGLSRRHVDRVLLAQGLAPAKKWVIAARVWHAVQLQRRKHLSLAEVARRLGYADPKALRRHRASVLGGTSEHEGDGQAMLEGVVAFLTEAEAEGPSS